VLIGWRDRRLADLLSSFDLAGLPEEPFPNDGWSGASLTRIRRGDERFILKRTSLDRDWIARATLDEHLREGAVAQGFVRFRSPIVSPYLGAAADGDGVAILMPDLSDSLLAWDDPERDGAVDAGALDGVLDAIARLHATRAEGWPPDGPGGVPWTPIAERLTLLGRPSAAALRAAGVAAGDRFLAGWDAFDRYAPAPAQTLIHGLALDPGPLVRALRTLPIALIHGDLKLANVALLPEGEVAFIDWQMVMRAPVAVELGWLLVANSGSLATPPGDVLDRYLARVGRRGDVPIGEPTIQADLTMIVGLLLRGWRKGLDADAGVTLPSGVTAVDDLGWWCDGAVAAGERHL
jgi:hypothetical protein